MFLKPRFLETVWPPTKGLMPLMNTTRGASGTDAVCRASALPSELGGRQEVLLFVISLSPRGSDAAVQSPAVLRVPWKPNPDQIQWEMLAEA